MKLRKGRVLLKAHQAQPFSVPAYEMHNWNSAISTVTGDELTLTGFALLTADLDLFTKGSCCWWQEPSIGQFVLNRKIFGCMDV
jgi:hypothetical protein